MEKISAFFLKEAIDVKKIDLMEFGIYTLTNLIALTRRFIAPSTCNFHTGQVWAKKWLDQFKLHFRTR